LLLNGCVLQAAANELMAAEEEKAKWQSSIDEVSFCYQVGICLSARWSMSSNASRLFRHDGHHVLATNWLATFCQ